jgi:hypothetical protein
MEERKTNTILLEPPTSEKFLPGTSARMDIFDELIQKEEKYLNDPVGYLAEAQQLQDAGKFREAFGMYETADILTNRDEDRKVAQVTYKMAETLHQLADSGTEGRDTSLKTLDEAEMWLTISDQYNASAFEKEKREIKTSRSRALKFGARAVMKTIKSSIKSTLNRHS